MRREALGTPFFSKRYSILEQMASKHIKLISFNSKVELDTHPIPQAIQKYNNFTVFPKLRSKRDYECKTLIQYFLHKIVLNSISQFCYSAESIFINRFLWLKSKSVHMAKIISSLEFPKNHFLAEPLLERRLSITK